MGQDEQTDRALVRKAREGLGDKIDLLIDAGLVWDAKTAIQRARAFEQSNIYWLEEPLRPDDYEGYRKLSQATSVRIAAGEEESNRLSYLDLMDRLAADRGLPVANHGFTTYINVVAALHWLNAIPNALICEFVAEVGTTLRDSITCQPVAAKDGYLEIPTEPGLGIDLDEDAVAQYRIH
jgi:L-rhamnonate dehydratase